MNVHSRIAVQEPDTSTSRRDAIIQAAMEVFAENGYKGSAIPPIAERAGVAVGTIYRHFADKQALVNEVFRVTKRELQITLAQGFDATRPARVLFDDFWARLTGFARQSPLAFQFMEMQDHLPYLDETSKRVEVEILSPIVDMLLTQRDTGLITTPMHTAPLIAMIWGAVVGMFKYERVGYYKLTDEDLHAARDALWSALTHSAPDTVTAGLLPAAHTAMTTPGASHVYAPT